MIFHVLPAFAHCAGPNNAELSSMSNHGDLMGASHSRARAAARIWRQFRSVGLSSVVVAIGLTGCGGGSEGPSGAEVAAPSGAEGQAVRAAVIQVPSTTLVGTGWAVVPPAHQLSKAGPIQACPQSRPNCKFYVDSKYVGSVMNGGVGTPFNSLAQVQAAIKDGVILAGDAVLLKCGSVFRGSLNLDGAVVSRPKPPKGLRIGAYDGSAEDCPDDQLPVINGASVVSGAWVQESVGSKYWTTSVLNPVRRLFVGGVPMVQARYPNAALGKNFSATSVAAAAGTRDQFLVSESDRVVFSALPEGSLVGATIFIRTTSFSIETARVSAYNTSTGLITVVKPGGLNSQLSYAVPKGAGYILQGKRWMADQAGEWFSEGVSNGNALYVHGAPPAGLIERQDQSWGLKAIGAEGLTVERVRFENQGYSSIEVSGSGIKVRGVESVNAGIVGFVLNGAGAAGVEVLGNRLRASGSVGIMTKGVIGAKVKGNYVEGTGRFLYPNPDGVIDVQAGIRVGAEGGEAVDNFILNSAGAGLIFDAPYEVPVTATRPIVTANVANNVVVNPCLSISDCGGIYTRLARIDAKPTSAELGEIWTARTAHRAVVSGNVVVGNKSNTDGCPAPQKDVLTGLDRPNVCAKQAVGIYLDDFTSNVKVSGNAVSGAEVGIYVHNGSHNLIQGNKVRGASHASFLASDDAVLDVTSEIMRGNVVKENVFVSRRAVALQNWDTSTAGSAGSLLMYNVPHTYAQLWLHKGDAAKFFSVDSAGRPANRSELNETLSLSKVEQPAVWRMGLNGQLVEYSGAIWGVRGTVNSKTTLEEMALPRWLAFAPPGDSLSADKESSPISYKPYTVKQGAAASLIDNFVSGAVWTPVNGTLFTMLNGTQPLAQCGGALSCGEARPASGDSLVASKAFSSKAGTTYLARLDVTAGSTGGAFSANVMVDGNAAGTGVWSTVSPNYIQINYFRANQTKRVEHFFQASISSPYAKLFLRPSDKTAAYARTMYFSNASIHPTTDLEALPSMSGLAAVAVNASANAKLIACAELGLSATAPCPEKLYDERNVEVVISGGAVTVPANTTLQLYAPSSKWSN